MERHVVFTQELDVFDILRVPPPDAPVAVLGINTRPFLCGGNIGNWRIEPNVAVGMRSAPRANLLLAEPAHSSRKVRGKHHNVFSDQYLQWAVAIGKSSALAYQRRAPASGDRPADRDGSSDPWRPSCRGERFGAGTQCSIVLATLGVLAHGVVHGPAIISDPAIFEDIARSRCRADPPRRKIRIVTLLRPLLVDDGGLFRIASVIALDDQY
jgi:hypothetical protein